MKTLILILSLLFYGISFAQPQLEWVAIYSPGISRALFLEVDNIGDVVVTGYEGDDWLTIKYSADGDTIWVQRLVSYNDPTHPNDMALDRWGNAIVVGATKDTLWQYRWYAIKYDADDGHVIWADMVENNNQNISDKAIAVAVDTLGRAVVVGGIKNGNYPAGTGFDWVAKCYSPSGITHWFDQFDNDTTGDAAIDVAVTKDGIAYVCGWTWDNITQNNLVRVHKYNYYGPDWTKLIPIYADSPTIKIALDHNQNVYVVSDEAVGYQDYGSIILIKYDTLGTQLWERRFSTQNSFDDQVIDIATDNNGDLIIACQFEDDTDLKHCQIVKYSANGDSLWAINQGSNTWPMAILTDTDRNIYVAGKMDNGIVTKYDPDGNEIWSASYGGPIYTYDIALDDQDNFFVCGQSGSDFITIKFSQNIGIKKLGTTLPEEFSLSQNYPNPFNPTTNIRFDIPKPGFTVIKVFDILGKEVATLVNEKLTAGSYEVDWPASSFCSGVYFYRLESGNYVETKKMLMIK